jgi:hypothetical protein
MTDVSRQQKAEHLGQASSPHEEAKHHRHEEKKNPSSNSARERNAAKIKQHFESVWDMVFQPEDEVFGNCVDYNLQVMEDFALWCSEPPESWEALVEACEALDAVEQQNEATTSISSKSNLVTQSHSNRPRKDNPQNQQSKQVTKIAEPVLIDQPVTSIQQTTHRKKFTNKPSEPKIQFESVWEMDEEVTEQRPSRLDKFVEEKNPLEFSEAPEDWEALCDDDDDEAAKRDEQSIHIEASQGKKENARDESSPSPGLVSLKEPMAYCEASSPLTQGEVATVKKISTTRDVDIDSVWDMYDEQKADDDKMRAIRVLDVLHKDDAPDSWEALVDDDELEEGDKDQKYTSKTKTIDSTPHNNTKGNLLKSKRRKRLPKIPSKKQVEDSKPVNSGNKKQVEQYDSVWDMVSIEDSAKDKNFGDGTDDNRLLQRKCFTLPTPVPTDDWETFYSEASQVF